MVRLILSGALLLAMATLPLLSRPAAATDPQAALSTCIGCHDISKDKKALVGPPLFGLVGRKPAISGVPFAAWDAKNLDQWLKDPSKVKADTTMAFKVKNDQKRAAIIQALTSLR